jgi:hypothetical protein
VPASGPRSTSNAGSRPTTLERGRNQALDESPVARCRDAF